VDPSRRQLIQDLLLAAGGSLLLPAGVACRETSARERGKGGYGARPPRVSKGRFEPGYLALERSGRLARIERRLWRMYDACRCCPRACKKKRSWGQVGECKCTSRLKVNSAGPHMGEERPLVGRNGSGTIFFSRCNLLCVFCQNWEVNHRGDGRYVTHEGLADTMLGLQKLGCHNINLVTPTHVVPNIVKALRIAIRKGLRLPLVYNTGGYDSLQVIRLLEGVVDIYMPDFKWQDGQLAARYAHKCKDYPRVAAAVIKEMHRQVGELTVDGRGVARRGLIVRHLVMPHNIAGTDRFVRWVAKELSPETFVNLMDQYRPAHLARRQPKRYPKIARRLTNEEWLQAVTWAQQAGLAHWRG
jgi:putative pyruvate formate lyase activating enzyme